MLAEVSPLFWLRPVGQRPHTEHLAARRLEEGRVVVTRQADREGETVAEATWVSSTAENPENGLRAGPLRAPWTVWGSWTPRAAGMTAGPSAAAPGPGTARCGPGGRMSSPEHIRESDEVQAALEASGHRLDRGGAPGDVGDTWVVRGQIGQPGGPRGSAGA